MDDFGVRIAARQDLNKNAHHLASSGKAQKPSGGARDEFQLVSAKKLETWRSLSRTNSAKERKTK